MMNFSQVCDLAQRCKRAVEPLLALYIVGYDADGKIVATALEHENSWSVRQRAGNARGMTSHRSAGDALTRLQALGAVTILAYPSAFGALLQNRFASALARR